MTAPARSSPAVLYVTLPFHHDPYVAALRALRARLDDLHARVSAAFAEHRARNRAAQQRPRPA